MKAEDNVADPVVLGIVEEIGRAIDDAADPEYKHKIARLVPGAKIVGVTVPHVRNLAKMFHANYRDLSLDQASQIMDALCKGGCREEVLFGIFLLGRFGKRVTGLSWQRIGEWAGAIDNWETCDQLASNVAGPVVAAHLEYAEHLAELARSKNRWKRRLAVATVSELNHKGMLHVPETLRICDLLLEDSEPMVSKAVAWAIREIGKKDEQAARDFLHSNQRRISAQLLREASEKLSKQSKHGLKPL